MFAIELKKFDRFFNGLQINNYKPIPVFEPNQVLVKVESASINPIDMKMSQGYGKVAFYQASKTKLPVILGRDFTGTVEAVGNSVKSLKYGDRVWGCVDFNINNGLKQGSHAEFIVVSEDECTIQPKNVSSFEAVTLPYAFLTAYSALLSTPLLSSYYYKGKNVLIQGGSGGVGSIAIQLLKNFGSNVIVTCSKDKQRYVKSLGADHVVSYEEEDYRKNLRSVDVILDLVGGLNEKHLTQILSMTSINSQKYINEFYNRYKKCTQTHILNEHLTSISQRIHLFDELISVITHELPHYISIVTPAVKIIDIFNEHYGKYLFLHSLLSKKIELFNSKCAVFDYATFRSNRIALEELTNLVSSGSIRAAKHEIIEKKDFKEGYLKISQKKCNGKVVLDMNS